MSTCEAQLSQLKQLLNVNQNETAALEGQIADKINVLLRVERIDHKGFLGPLLLGYLLEIFLFGVLIMQIRYYHRHFTHDKFLLKLTAWTSFLGSLTLTVAIFVDSWDRLIATNVAFVHDSMTPSSELVTIMIALLGLLSHIFFAWRIYELSRKWWWQVPISCLAVAQFVAFIVVNVHYMTTRPTNGLSDFITTPSRSSIWIKDPSTPIWMVTTIVCDLSITVSMAVLLYPMLKEAVSCQTQPMISATLLLIFETGIMSVILAMLTAGLLLSGTPSMQYRWYIFFYPSGVLYSTWLLGSLSTRNSEDKSSSPVTSTTQSCCGDINFQSPTQRHDISVTITNSCSG